ncbi:MAG TPA: CAP domain-containing protein [Patescibacteria group bacterium]|nr:CAP domain-containing protein [Patescibacteria group bacterium]
MRPLPLGPLRPGATLATILALVVALGVAAFGPIPVTAASLTTASAEASLLALTNRDRAALGLRPLRSDSRLVVIARARAGNLAASATFSHAAAGESLTLALGRAGVQYYAWGETLARQSGGLTRTTVAAIHRAWRNSAAHWALLMSRTMNYIGFGVVRASDGQAFATAILTESRDRTGPRAKIDSATLSGTTITFTWHGFDPALQTHWAGLRDYDVWYRVDDAAWRMVRDNTTATSLRLPERAPGHRYWLMVRARDRAGNVGRPGAPVSVWIP